MINLNIKKNNKKRIYLSDTEPFMASLREASRREGDACASPA